MPEKKDDEKGGFLDKVKDFIHDVSEKFEEVAGFGKPTVDVSAIHIPIPLVDVNYLIESKGRQIVAGLIPDVGTIRAHGSETIKVPLTLIYDDIKSTSKDIEPGSILPYKVKVELIIDIPVMGRVTIPVEMEGEISVPYKPEVDQQKEKMDRFLFEEFIEKLYDQMRLQHLNLMGSWSGVVEVKLWESAGRLC